MLVEFRVGNFLSFKDKQTLRLKWKNKDGSSGSSNHAFIYGPNGSGKSNFIKAMSYSRECIVSGSHKMERNMSYRNVDGDYYDGAHTYFEYELELNGSKYAYGFEIDYNHRDYQSEWLYELKEDEEVCVYEVTHSRENGDTFKGYFKPMVEIGSFDIGSFDIERNRHIIDDFCLKGNKDADPLLAEIYDWFENKFIVRTSEIENESTVVPGDYLQFLKRQLGRFDTGISDIKLYGHGPEPSISDDKIVGGPGTVCLSRGVYRDIEMHYTGSDQEKREVHFVHRYGDKIHEARIDQESKGTLKIIQLLTALYSNKSPESNGIIVIDELECSIHTSIMRSLVKLMDEENFKDVQVVVTTHESGLLMPECVDQNSVWFVDARHSATKEGSRLYPLRAFNGNISKYEGMYLNGRFSAVPLFLGDLQEDD